MMKNLARIAALGACLAGTFVGSIAWAQDGATAAPGAPQPAGGRRQTTPGENVRRSFTALQYFGPVYTWTIAFWPEVREAINIDRDQMMAVGKIMMTNRPPAEGASGDPEGAFKRYHLNNDDAVLKSVKPEQRKRLQELFVQYNGGMALTKFEVAKEVGISEEIKTKITTLVRANTKLIREEGKKREAGQEVKTPIDQTKMFKDAKATIESWLTETQLAKLKELGGEKFEFREHPIGSPMGRGPANGIQSGSGRTNGGPGSGRPNRAGGGSGGSGAGSGNTQTGVKD